MDGVTANIRLGELHSVLAMLCAIEQSGTVESPKIRQLYRTALDRYSQAENAAAWTNASLSIIDDLSAVVTAPSRDAAIRILLGTSAPFGPPKWFPESCLSISSSALGSSLEAFGATVRLAREWIVEAASSEAKRRIIQQQSLGLLSLTRRKALLEGIAVRDWPAVWESASVSDLYFLGSSLLEHAPAELWNNPALLAMRRTASQSVPLDVLGQVAPPLSGCAAPRVRRYQPYEEYQRHMLPERVAERAAELKFYLAWLADSSALPAGALAAITPTMADAVTSKMEFRDLWDWGAALEAYRGLTPDTLELLMNQP
ncbi:MAG: hypothetical protein JO097_16580 [Acidobacteriaceae bacterium]|nr:hypothetical protein [Acidobacteriaceae bacterium]MBV9763504.1 hypothetical protein [Acidobacteriaceae bacterium]